MSRYRYQYFPGPCGQYALVNAMAVLGKQLSILEAHRLTGVTVWEALRDGTDTRYLVKAIRKCGCTPHLVTRMSEVSAKRAMDRLLDRGWPVIVSVDESSHWAVVASRSKRGYRWIDSADTRITGYWSWSSIADWMEDEDGYCMIGVESDQ